MQELEIALGHIVCSELGSGGLAAADSAALLWELNRILPFLCCSRASSKGAQRVLLPLPVQLSVLSHVLLCCTVLRSGASSEPCPVLALATTATQASCETNKQHNLTSSITGVTSLMDTVAVPILCMWGKCLKSGTAAAGTAGEQAAALRREAAIFVQDVWCNTKICASPSITARGALQVMSFLANLNRGEASEAHALVFASPDEYPSAFNRYADVLKPHASVIEVTGGAAAGAGSETGASTGLVSYVPTPPRSAQSAAFDGLAAAVETLTAHGTKKCTSASHPFQFGFQALGAGAADGLHATVAKCVPGLSLSIAQGAVAATVHLNELLLDQSKASFQEYAVGVDVRMCAGLQLALCAAPWLAPSAACQQLEAASTVAAPAAENFADGGKKRKSRKSKKATSGEAAAAASPLQLAVGFMQGRATALAAADPTLVTQQCEVVLCILSQLHKAGAVREDKDRSPFPLFSTVRFLVEGVLGQLQALQAHTAIAAAVKSVLQTSRSIMQHKLPSMLAAVAASGPASNQEAAAALATALLTAGTDRQLPVTAFTAVVSCILAASGQLPAFSEPLHLAGRSAPAETSAGALELLKHIQVATALVDTSLNMPNGQVVPFASLLGCLVAACAGSTGLHTEALHAALVRGAGPVLTASGTSEDKLQPVVASLGMLAEALKPAEGAGATTKQPKTPKSAKKRRRDSSPAPQQAASQAAHALSATSRMFVAQVATIRVTRSNFPSVAALANSMSMVVAQILSSDAPPAAFACGVQLMVCVQNIVAALAAYIPELSPNSAAWEGQWGTCGWMACIPPAVQAAQGLLDGAASGKSLMELPFSQLCERLSSVGDVPGALPALLQRAVFAAAAFHATDDDSAKSAAAQASKLCLQDPSLRTQADVALLLSHLPVLQWAAGAPAVQQWCAALHDSSAAQAPLLALLGSEFMQEYSLRAPAVAAALFSACTSQVARFACSSKASKKVASSPAAASLLALAEPCDSMQDIKAAMAPVVCEADMAAKLAAALKQCRSCISPNECARAVAVAVSVGQGSDACIKLLSSNSTAVTALAGLSAGDSEWLLRMLCGDRRATAAAIHLAAQALAQGTAAPSLPSTSAMKSAGVKQWLQLAAAAACAVRSSDKATASAAVPLILSLGSAWAADNETAGAAMAALQQVALLAAATHDAALLRAACKTCTAHSVPQAVALDVFKAAVSTPGSAFLDVAVQFWVECTAYEGDNSLLTSLESADGEKLALLVAAACALLSKPCPSATKHGALQLLQACLQHPAAFDSAQVGQSAQVLVPQIPILLRQSQLDASDACLEAAVLLSAATAITASPSMVALTARDVTAILISATSLVTASAGAADDLVLQVFTLLNQVAKHHKRVITAILPVACALLVNGLKLIKGTQGEAAGKLSSMLYRCCVQLVRSARPAAVRHHAPQLVAAFVTAAAAQRQSGAAEATTDSVSADKAVLEGMYRIFDTMSASEFQHVFSAVAEYPGARQVLKTARKQWTAEHRYTGQ